MTHSMIRFLAAVAAVLCTACAGASPAGDTMPTTLAQIKSLIGPAACNAAADCRTTGVGVRACGGPEAYLAWSTRSTDAGALRVLTERYAQERRAAIQRSGELSTCSILRDPGATCVAGQCRPGMAGPDPT